MSMLKVPKDTVLDDWDLPSGNPKVGVKVISDDIVDHRRWSVDHELIVEINGQVYKTWYSVGATESQDESPWEYDKEVEFIPQKKVTKTIEVWVDAE